jgi:hypothetical protein
MKKKLKKLSLNTETLRTLTEPSLQEAAGGITLLAGCETSDATRACSLCTLACTGCCP